MNKQRKPGLGALWWPIGLGTCFVSAIVAILFDKNDAIREMATSAFGGGVIGLLILFYEQYREDHRDQKQDERNRKLTVEMQKNANREADIRSCADFLLKELKPAYDDFFNSVLGVYQKTLPPEDIQRCRQIITPLITTAQHYVKRVDDANLTSSWDEFSNFLTRVKTASFRVPHITKEKKAMDTNSMGGSETFGPMAEESNRIMQSLLDSSEGLLKSIDD